MASASRQFVRAATRTSTRTAFSVAPRQAFRQNGRRYYSSEPVKKSSSLLTWVLGATAIGAGGYVYLNGGSAAAKVFTPTKEDYQKVYDEVASRLEEKDDYDDGSFGPVLLRLAWHASGTFDKATGTGGSNGATMRFNPEAGHGANAGLIEARNFLEPVKGESSPWRRQFDPMLTQSHSQVPLDHLLRPLDPRWCLRYPGDAGSRRPLPTRPR